MRILEDIASRLGVAGELIKFLWIRKLWWLIPMMTMLLVLGFLIVFGSTSGVGPFIYTLF